ncbi:MAG: c-type cytochrome [Methylophilaceae bacterium]
MQKIKLSALYAFLLVSVVACGKGDNAASGSSPAAGSDVKMITFVTTQDSSPLVVKAELFDTPAAKEFMTTGKNLYIGNAEAIEKGKKLFQLYSCTQCHGPEAKGQVGPGLIGPDYRYPKDATNKGMFETIWHGTNGGMGAKGKGLMDPSDPSNGITPDELLKIIAWIRSYGGVTGNE